MQVHFGIELLQPEWTRAIVCIGTFDGVHLGHQQVITSAVSRAKKEELPSIVVTFDRHPAHVLTPHKAPKAIGSLKMNLERFQELGVGLVVVLPFNAWLSRMSAEDFLNDILLAKLRASTVVVGHDFALGNGREGNTEWLSSRIDTEVIVAFEVEGHRASSSLIRESVASGNLELTNKLLGRGFEIQGFVDHGQKLGRTLGYPTANIARSFDQVLPADGVYAAEFLNNGHIHKAALAIGTRPAVGGGPRSIEAFLLDYNGESLYGQHIRLRLQHFLRPEQNFKSLDDLKVQMAKDVESVRTLLA
jgi:riboflavin kinase / FMN adenylyltransferase